MTRVLQAGVELARLPHPYRAAVTVVNDIDGTSPEAFRSQHNLLTGDREDEFGMEIGNSFWMYDVGSRDRAFAYFKDRGPQRSAHATMIRDLASAGYLDVLHSYGNFLGVGDFRRALAEQAIERLVGDGLRIRVWTNHGGNREEQSQITGSGSLHHNIGRVYNSLGDRPESVAYHADLLLDYGIRYVWDGLCWEIVGQERPASLLEGYLSPRGSVRPFSVPRRAVKGLLALTGRGESRRPLPGNPSPVHTYAGDNHLLSAGRLLDGQSVYEFKRYGAFSRGLPQHIPALLHPRRLAYLVKVGGIMLVYNHLGKGATAKTPFPLAATAAFAQLASEYRVGRILVATVGRLLDYNRMVRCLEWSCRDEDDGLRLDVGRILDPLFGERALDQADLGGITFLVPRERTVRCYLNGQLLKMERARCLFDPGRDSVYRPWAKLPAVRL